MAIIGLAGSFLVCLGYFLLIRGKVGPYNTFYLAMNLAGGLCLLAALLTDFRNSNLGPAILQAVMIGISCYGFYKGRKS